MTEIAIVEDDPEIRRGLSSLIEGTPGYGRVCAHGSMEEALGCACPDRADVVLVDIGLPGMSGIEGIGRWRPRRPGALFLVLTVFRDDDRIFEALCAGASGYLLKNTPPSRLMESIAEMMQGGAPMSPEIARRVIERFRGMRRPADLAYNLTPHETRLLLLLVEGHSYKTAAAELRSSYHTVCFHMKNIYEKLHVHSKSEAVSKALRSGLVR